MERKLASIQKIKNVVNHPNADRLDIVQVLGWFCITKRDEFKAGDWCVYFEIDSILPPWECFSFLADKKYRVKTMKLRGALSQGLALPLSIFDNCLNKPAIIDEGIDVTDIIGVTKYEPIQEFWTKLRGDIQNKFPSFCRKSDEIRIQTVVPNIFTDIIGERMVCTIKQDGTSGTFYFNNGDYGVCSRNFQLKEKADNVYWFISNKYDIENKLRKLGKNIQIIGEICGPGIQRNPLNLKEPELFVFTGFNIDEQKYINHPDLQILCKQLDLNMVPIIDDNFIFTNENANLDFLLNFAKGYYKGTNHFREGVVFRSYIEKYNYLLDGRTSFKVINNDYLLKEE